MFELYNLRPIPAMPENHSSSEKISSVQWPPAWNDFTVKAEYLEKFTAEFETDLGVNQETR